MKIFESLYRNPLESSLANDGQARVSSLPDEQAVRELRAELETFVCDGQFGQTIEKILRNYLTDLDRPRQKAAWISGFYGSGKSHLLKMLGHLWVDTQFEDGHTARSLVHSLPDEVTALLRELDTQAVRSGKPLFAAAGTMPSGSGERVRRTVLSIILRAAGLPELFPQAQFVFWLQREGFYDHVRSAIENERRDWQKELNDLYTSDRLANALLECDPNFARDRREARQVLRARFPDPSGDITTAEFLEAVRSALAPYGRLPLTILVLDEVQQYIADSKDRATIVTELTEAVQTQLDSRVMLVMSGQAVLSDTPTLQKLQDRFRIRVHLSDAEVEAVTRKVLLHKRPNAVAHVRAVLDQNAGEVSKHLQGTRLAERLEDQQTIIEDYPLLPTRRRFWEEAFRAVDEAGTHSQLRSQLRILHDVLQEVAPRDLGAAIPADALYEAIAPDMVNTGVLLNEISTRIQSLDDGSPDGRLRQRIAGLVFLLNRLPQNLGVPATARNVADLMVDDVRADSGPFRKRVQEHLDALAESGTLMKVGEEYRLQTAAGAEWDRAFRERVQTFGQKEIEIAAKREQLVASAVQKTLAEIRLSHGESNERRSLTLHARPEEPTAEGDQVVVWLRDGWTTEQSRVEQEARKRGTDDPIIHVFLPRKSADELRRRIVEAEAARGVLDLKGAPSSDEGREARRSMESRLAAAEGGRDELVNEIVAAARVYQGGGTEVYGDSLTQKLRSAAEASLARLFPRFPEADHKAWSAAIRRARDGSGDPLRVVGWDRPTEEHPVVKEVLATIGSGAKGNEIRKVLKVAPYGWPQDAIDGSLIALHNAGIIRAEHNGALLVPKSLDQNKIPAATFTTEQIRLTTTQKLSIRGLFQQVGITVRSGEEEAKAGEFIDASRKLANAAGGDPPLPARPSTVLIDDIARLAGNEQLAEILNQRQQLEADIEAWQARSERAEVRFRSWNVLQRLLTQAEAAGLADEVRPQVQAIEQNRSLLDETDYVLPLRKKLETALREAVTAAHSSCRTVFDNEHAQLQADEAWQRLDDGQREQIIARHRIEAIDGLAVNDEERLLASLSKRSVEGWNELTLALPARFAEARADAIRALEPKTQTVSLRSGTLRTPEDVKAWIGETEKNLLHRLDAGPIVIS